MTRVERKDEEITLFSCERVQFLQHTYLLACQNLRKTHKKASTIGIRQRFVRYDK